MIDWSQLGPPLAITAAAAAGAGFYALRKRSTGAAFPAAGGTTVFAALEIALFMGPHTVVTVAQRIAGHGKPMSLVTVNVLGVAYDFRLYSLALVGILFLMQAAALLRTARGISAGEEAARKAARRACWKTILLAVPLAPISPGVPFLVAPAVINMALLKWAAIRSRQSLRAYAPAAG